MKNTNWLSRLFNPQPSTAMIQRIAGTIGVAILGMTAGMAVAQNATPATPFPTPGEQITVPDGYTLHQSVDMGGRMASTTGSGAMYDTLVNLQSGPRVQGETFELRALPGKKNTLVDSLTAFGSGFGGDPNSFTKLDFSKGKIYEFSGLFRRDRQYFDYDLLGNPNITTGLSIPIGPAATPSGQFAWPQVKQSPELFNTVRRMTDTNLKLFPLSKVTFRAGYSQNIFQGPSLSPSGYQIAGSYALQLQEFQRNSTDDFTGAIDWKPIEGTKLTFEEQVDHYKGDSYFTMAPSAYKVQESDGTPAAFAISFDSQVPYGTSACNTTSMINRTTILYPSANGLPIIDPACGVITSYSRTQPTRILYPTEIFRLQSSSIKNVTMNGDVRYTKANMNLPNYYDSVQGLVKTSREITIAGNANARREVMSADYGIVWQVAKLFSISDQVDYSNVHQPGTSSLTSVTTVSTVGASTINNPNLTTTVVNAPTAPATSPIEGSSVNLAPLPGYFGQRFLTNNLTGTWNASSRATLSLTYRYGTHTIADGSVNPGNIPIPVGADSGGTVTINETAGVFGAAVRVTNNWNINGSVEAAYADNAFTPVGPRQTRHYRMHTMFRPKPWATISGAYNDLERHNNTNNAQQDVAAAAAAATPTAPPTVLYYGPLDHVDHSRVASLSADLSPNEHYGFNFSYAFSSVYTATNICYTSGATATAPGAATAPGTSLPAQGVYANGVCQDVFSRGSITTLVDWYGRDFMDAPTQNASVGLTLSPVSKFHSGIGYRISSVSGNQLFADARAVNGSLNSAYQSPYVNAAWTVRPGLIWKAEYNFYGYGEGGPSGAQYCSTSTGTTTVSVTPVLCTSLLNPTGLTEPSSGLTAPRNFHANNITLGVHYEF